MRYVLFVLFIAGGACSQQFKTFLAEETGPYGQSSSGVQLTFLGTSSFLVNTETSSVLIDGYISRERHNLILPIEPNIGRIADTLHALEIATPSSPDFLPQRSSLAATRTLDAITPLHGHYDHAMDVAVVAGLTDATLFGDDGVARIVQKSQERFEWLTTAFDPLQFRPLEITQDTTITIVVGDITITLFETPHSTNILSRGIEAFGDPQEWTFPAYVSNMKQGASMAAHVQVGDQAFLVFPTAGELNGQVTRLGLRAETVFVGFGGLGWQSDTAIRTFFEETIVASKAKRVFPIHWDDHQRTLEGQLAVPFYEALDRAFVRIENQDAIEVLPLKAMQPFDPFYEALD
jgi:L-ascorbate metabolism protein UlaG (beta-lactamase superfamily)